MGIQVIGAGLARTGTMSLKMALETLGYHQCFHIVELLKNPQRLKFLDPKLASGSSDWDAVFQGYQAAVDYPACLYYETLLKQNPTAKVILTLRDPEQWYQSVLNTVYRGKPKGVGDVVRLIKGLLTSSDMRRLAPVFMYNDKLIWRGQFQSKFEDKAWAIQVYNDHIEQVKQRVPANQLLIFEVKQGWEPLCYFLDKPIPDTPFPRANSQAEFNRKMDRLFHDGVFEP